MELKVIFGAVVAVVLGLFYWFTRRGAQKLGETLGGLEADKKRAKEAADSGSDDEVLKEWRRQNKP